MTSQYLDSKPDASQLDENDMHQTWIVMEYMDGGTLASALRRSIVDDPGRPKLVSFNQLLRIETFYQNFTQALIRIIR